MDEFKQDRRITWQTQNQDRIIIMTPKDQRRGITKAQIKAAAAAAGQSVNAWIIDAIRDKL